MKPFHLRRSINVPFQRYVFLLTADNPGIAYWLVFSYTSQRWFSDRPATGSHQLPALLRHGTNPTLLVIDWWLIWI